MAGAVGVVDPQDERPAAAVPSWRARPAASRTGPSAGRRCAGSRWGEGANRVRTADMNAAENGGRQRERERGANAAPYRRRGREPTGRTRPGGPTGRAGSGGRGEIGEGHGTAVDRVPGRIYPRTAAGRLTCRAVSPRAARPEFRKPGSPPCPPAARSRRPRRPPRPSPDGPAPIKARRPWRKALALAAGGLLTAGVPRRRRRLVRRGAGPGLLPARPSRTSPRLRSGPPRPTRSPRRPRSWPSPSPETPPPRPPPPRR